MILQRKPHRCLCSSAQAVTITDRMHVLLFDIDGTLLNTGGAGQAAMERALQMVFGVTRPTEGISAAGRTDRAITRDLLAWHGIEETQEIREQFHQTYLRCLEEVLPELTGHVLPGVAELLQILSAREDVILGLLTGNLARGAELKLRHYNLYHYFVGGGFGDDHHERDDVARLARRVIEEHRRSPIDDGRLWVIGDTPHDVQCGRAIGARVAAVATGAFTLEELRVTEPDELYEDLSDPQQLLDAIL
jgi:phosphoglycolate phosphatase